MNRIPGILFVMLALPVSALAQAPPDWTLKLRLGKPVFLTTETGERVEGVAGQVTPDAVIVSTPVGIRTVRYADLRQAEKRDSVWTGVAIGAGVGAAIGITAVAKSDCTTDECVAESGGAIIGAAIYGGLIGWGIDALVKGKTTVFRSGSAPGLTIAPRRGGLSATAVLRW